MGADDDFERLLSGQSEVRGQSEDERDPASRLQLPYAIDAAVIRRKTGLSQAAFALRIGIRGSSRKPARFTAGPMIVKYACSTVVPVSGGMAG